MTNHLQSCRVDIVDGKIVWNAHGAYVPWADAMIAINSRPSTEELQAQAWESGTCPVCGTGDKPQTEWAKEAASYALEAIWQLVPEVACREEAEVLLTAEQAEKLLRRFGWVPPNEQRKGQP